MILKVGRPPVPVSSVHLWLEQQGDMIALMSSDGTNTIELGIFADDGRGLWFGSNSNVPDYCAARPDSGRKLLCM